MFKPIGRLPNGFYESFETLPETDALAGLLEAWSTPEQRAYNASTVTCTECKGHGYKITRKGRNVIRDNCGCPTCLGLGKVPKRSEGAVSAAA